MPHPDRATKDEDEVGKDELEDEHSDSGVCDVDDIRARLGPGNYSAIAREAGCSRQQVSRVLRGLSGVSMELAKRIAQAAKVGLDDMFQYIEGARGQRWVRCECCEGLGRVQKAERCDDE